jgi:hypothetical protein
MSLIRETMLKRAGATGECIGHASGDEDRAEWSVTAGNSFADEDEVGLNVPMIYGEDFSGAAHAGHDFVDDKENSLLATDFRDALCVSVGRSSRAKCGTDDRLEDEGSGGGGIIGV